MLFRYGFITIASRDVRVAPIRVHQAVSTKWNCHECFSNMMTRTKMSNCYLNPECVEIFVHSNCSLILDRGSVEPLRGKDDLCLIFHLFSLAELQGSLAR
jgi:hypothetical protein